jgi:hypothetical protein
MLLEIDSKDRAGEPRPTTPDLKPVQSQQDPPKATRNKTPPLSRERDAAAVAGEILEQARSGFRVGVKRPQVAHGEDGSRGAR